MSVEDLGGGTSDYDFLGEMEKSIDFKGEITDFEWDLRNKQWEEQRDKVVGHMLDNNIWSMLPRHRHSEGGMESSGSERFNSMASTIYAYDTSVAQNSRPKTGESSSGRSASKLAMKSVPASALSNVSRIVWKVPKMSQLELFKYLEDWDKVRFEFVGLSKDDMMTVHDFEIFSRPLAKGTESLWNSSIRMKQRITYMTRTSSLPTGRA